MSGGISASTVAMMAAAAVAGSVVMSSMNKPPSPGSPPAPGALPQASQMPDAGGIRRQNANAESGPMASLNNTLLTGPSGVSNDLFSLGKNTLLGG